MTGTSFMVNVGSLSGHVTAAGGAILTQDAASISAVRSDDRHGLRHAAQRDAALPDREHRHQDLAVRVGRHPCGVRTKARPRRVGAQSSSARSVTSRAG